ncbi:hypothetical protein GWI33_002426 [Rhynchophorus ferrugineus]|uniref:Uncharacterized protein n=1 Tax=Rhynchophorus ferrugineus TaxID=354439 RepID=A0A834IXI0_RHYFE|nr:hypothetical protein GWI33_002426 [Rhynchophorus ferrugineus]
MNEILKYFHGKFQFGNGKSSASGDAVYGNQTPSTVRHCLRNYLVKPTYITGHEGWKCGKPRFAYEYGPALPLAFALTPSFFA